MFCFSSNRCSNLETISKNRGQKSGVRTDCMKHLTRVTAACSLDAQYNSIVAGSHSMKRVCLYFAAASILSKRLTADIVSQVYFVNSINGNIALLKTLGTVQPLI